MEPLNTMDIPQKNIEMPILNSGSSEGSIYQNNLTAVKTKLHFDSVGIVPCHNREGFQNRIKEEMYKFP